MLEGFNSKPFIPKIGISSEINEAAITDKERNIADITTFSKSLLFFKKTSPLN